MRQPPRKKPTSVDEIGRVLRIYDVLAEEIDRRITPRYIPVPRESADGTGKWLWPSGTAEVIPGVVRYDILAVAERIAARTED